MPKPKIYAGLEIGTSKIVCVVGETRPDSTIKILGRGQAPSRGIRKGEIVDDKMAEICVRDAVHRAEETSDIGIDDVLLSITGAHIESVNHTGRIRVPEDHSQITEEDLAEAKEMARHVVIPQQNVILHSVTRNYTLDGQDKIRVPVGRVARTLQAHVHMVHGVRQRIQNHIRFVRNMPLRLDNLVFAPLAAATIALTREEKDNGALLIDIGGGTSDYVLYVDGVLCASGCVGLGGDHFTSDLAQVLRIPQSRAERLKIERGTAWKADADVHEAIRLDDDPSPEPRVTTPLSIAEILYERAREIFEQIHDRLLEDDLLKRISAGIFLTGGTSLMHGIERVATETFKIPAKPIFDEPVSGVTAVFEDPRYSTAIGIIRYAQILDRERTVGPRQRGLFARVRDMVSRG